MTDAGLKAMQEVQVAFPRAHAWSSWMQDGRWFVSTSTDERVSIMEYASGETEDAAWIVAAERLKNEQAV